MIEAVPLVLGALSGTLVGFTLGLVGGGGSILAVPLLVYIVGVSSLHMAIGTSAVAVAVNAANGLVNHARAGTVRWRCGSYFAGAGAIGALLGSTAGKLVDGSRLLALFAVLMLAIGAVTLRWREAEGDPTATCEPGGGSIVRVLGFGVGSGVISGFFGIGGGFLIVPALIASTRMPMINAVGSSLIAVTAFGVVTGVNYALSGWVDWPLAAIFVAGGTLGGWMGAHVASRLAARDALRIVFAGIIFAVALFILARQL